jgi:hypothetical protein
MTPQKLKALELLELDTPLGKGNKAMLSIYTDKRVTELVRFKEDYPEQELRSLFIFWSKVRFIIMYNS